MNLQSKLFVELARNPPQWWKNLMADEDIWADVRRGKINVYYKGSSIMDLRWQKGFVAKIHPEYVPFEREKTYVSYVFDASGNIHAPLQRPLELNAFSRIAIKQIKTRVKQVNKPDSEKSIQGDFATQNAFIDTELAHKEGEDNTRIDLTWVDEKSKRIVFVELKTMNDRRLLGPEVEKKGKESIAGQMSKYRRFIMRNSNELLTHYQNVFKIKQSLGILPRSMKVDSLDSFAIEECPLLLVADCTDAWIRENAERINEKLANDCLGTVFLGTKREFRLPRRSDSRLNRNLFRS